MAIDSNVSRDEIYEAEIEDSDYGFVVDEDGDLKAVFLPHDMPDFEQDIPEKVMKIFKIFGIKNPGGVETHSVH